MTDQTCPHCHGSVMTFGKFLWFAELTATIKCPDCGAELKRSRSGWWLLVAGVIACIILSKFAIVCIARKMNLPESSFEIFWGVGGILFLIALFFILKIVRYKYAPWLEVSAPSPTKP